MIVRDCSASFRHALVYHFPFLFFVFFFPLCFPFDCCIYIPSPGYRLSTYLKSSVCSVCAGSDVCIRFFLFFSSFSVIFLHFYILGGVRHDREESDVFLSDFCGTNWGRNWSPFLRTCGGLLVRGCLQFFKLAEICFFCFAVCGMAFKFCLVELFWFSSCRVLVLFSGHPKIWFPAESFLVERRYILPIVSWQFQKGKNKNSFVCFFCLPIG